MDFDVVKFWCGTVGVQLIDELKLVQFVCREILGVKSVVDQSIYETSFANVRRTRDAYLKHWNAFCSHYFIN